MAQGVKVDETVHHNIARLAQQGKSGNQIAKDLGIARSTVQEHLKRLRAGAGVSHGQDHVVPADTEPIPTLPASEASPVALMIDPEFHGLIPALTGEARAQLEANLRAEGCRDPLVVWPQDDDAPILLDGHNRYEICQQYGLPFRMVEAQGISTREDAQIWIVRNQLGRRNLQDFQRIELAERLRPLLEAKAKGKQQEGGREKVPQNFAEPVETRQAIAEIAGVSRETVRKAEVILEDADEPTKEALRRGKRKIHDVHQRLRGPRAASNRKPTAEASAVAPTPATPPTMEPDPQVCMAERLIELAGAMRQELAMWREQFPQATWVQSLLRMESELSKMEEYLRAIQQRAREAHQQRMAALAASVEVLAPEAQPANKAGEE
jgi:DNA invertase Pin-like site-specific DNA recombinase